MTNDSVNPLLRIVDDEETALEGLSFMLSCEGYEVRAYRSAIDFLHDDMPSVPGCLILDVRMPEMTGLELFDELRRRGYRQPVLFLTGHGDIEMAVEAMRNGAADFLVKPVDGTKLAEAVARALASVRSRTLGLPDSSTMRERWESLTSREQEILRLVAAGRMNKEAAIELDISVRTVEGHRASALRKLGVQTPAQIAAFVGAADAWS